MLFVVILVIKKSNWGTNWQSDAFPVHLPMKVDYKELSVNLKDRKAGK